MLPSADFLNTLDIIQGFRRYHIQIYLFNIVTNISEVSTALQATLTAQIQHLILTTQTYLKNQTYQTYQKKLGINNSEYLGIYHHISNNSSLSNMLHKDILLLETL